MPLSRQNEPDWARQVRDLVEQRLAQYWAEKRVEVEAISPQSLELIEALKEFTSRGGKRLRPLIAAAALKACDESRSFEQMTNLGAAFEVLQSYLLIHDDWMDHDLERRGGPALHHAFASKYGDTHLGHSLGILSGDFASTLAWELFLATPFDKELVPQACTLFIQMQAKVYCGQHLDLTGNENVKLMHQLKTTSYTVLGPAKLGALLANASTAQKTCLEAWANPIGQAFQLRDDLLSTFGDANTTGKPGNDLIHGKRNALISSYLDSGQKPSPAFQKTWGRPESSRQEIGAALESLREAGIVDAVEKEITTCTENAQNALDPELFSQKGIALLRDLGARLSQRKH